MKTQSLVLVAVLTSFLSLPAFASAPNSTTIFAFQMGKLVSQADALNVVITESPTDNQTLCERGAEVFGALKLVEDGVQYGLYPEEASNTALATHLARAQSAAEGFTWECTTTLDADTLHRAAGILSTELKAALAGIQK